MLRATLRRLRYDRSGLALMEFAFSFPPVMLLALTGAEFTNYMTVRMRVSQAALHLADNAARIGNGPHLAAQTINEADINDLLTGAGIQAGDIDLYGRGRVVVSSLEPVSGTNPTQYRIRWNRCRGAKTTFTPTYKPSDPATTTGIGPAGRTIIAPDNGVTMFVEVYYEYKPIVDIARVPTLTILQSASMMVRDRRDTVGGTNGVYQVTGVTPSPSC